MTTGTIYDALVDVASEHGIVTENVREHLWDAAAGIVANNG